MLAQPPPDDLIAQIRQRPEVYVGTRGSEGLHELIYEALVYSLKEALVKRCTRLDITLNYDYQIIVSDNSSGIDTRLIAALGISFLELKLTRRSTDRHQGMEAHPLYGLGLPVINALSQVFTAEVRRDGFLWRQEYCYGEKQTPVMRVRSLLPNESTGLTLRFKPDFEIFEQHELDYAALALRLRMIAFLVPDLEVTLKDERIGLRDHFHYLNGLRELTRFLNRGQVLLHDPIYGIEEIETLMIDSWSYTVRVEIAFQYILSGAGTQRIFVNTLRATANPEAQRGLRAGLLWVLNRYARKQGLLREADAELNVNEISVGLTAVISIYHLYTSTGNQKLARMLQQNTWDAALRATINAVTLLERQRPQELRRIVEHVLQRRRDH